MKKFRRIFSLISAKQDGSGHIVQFQLPYIDDVDSRCIFVSVANQFKDTNTETARFDYKNLEKLKLNPIDIGAILSVINHREDSINKDKGLYHQFEDKKTGKKTTSSLKLKKNAPNYGGYYMSIMKNEVKIGTPITNANAEVLKSFLEAGLWYIYGE